MTDPPSSDPLDPIERRRHSRSYVAGVALVSHLDHSDSGACLVRNLSEQGALLLSSPPLSPGQTCRMVLTAPGLMGEQLDAYVTRAGLAADGAAWAAVEFLALPDEKALRLRKLVDLELLAANAPAVLVVDGSVEKLQTAAAQLAEYSRRSHLANTSLMAVDWLVERGRYVALAVVGDGVVGCSPDEFLEFIGDEYPKIHRARMSCFASDDALRCLLDRVEFENPAHAPWREQDFGSF